MVEKFVIVGSNSFSGASFVDHLLKNGAGVVGISRSEEPAPVFLPYRWENGGDRPGSFQFHALDLNRDLDRIIEVIKEAAAPFVVNFAAQGMVAESWKTPEHWFQTNTVANIRFHDRLRKLPFLKKYVHISTPEVYGNCEGLVDESAPFNPSTPYATSRAACDFSLRNFHQNYGFPVVWTRAANVYGPGQQLYRIIPRTVLCARTGKKLQLHGGGHSVRSFIHIRDVAAATARAALQGAPGDTFHLSTDRFISIRDLVAMIAEKMDVPFDDLVEISGERPGKDAAYTLDSSRAAKKLAWTPEISLEEGVDETIRWVDNNLDEILKQPLEYQHKP